MERKNRLIFSILIGAVVVIAVLSSFGLNLFAASTPKIVLPSAPPVDATQAPNQNSDYAVSVTTQTVQSVIATLERRTSYERTITLDILGANGTMNRQTTKVWEDNGWTRTEVTRQNQAAAEHTLVGEGTVYRWRGTAGRVTQWPADAAAADLSQHIPTYEDVLDLPQETIIAADYVTHEGVSCVYVAAKNEELGYELRYWVSIDDGLLVFFEQLREEELLLQLRAPSTKSPVTAGTQFALPDGTVLHEVGQVEGALATR